MAAAHDAGIIHRDIKPANIFLCARSISRPGETAPGTGAVRSTDDPARVKLLDFGIAKLTGQTGLTRTGTTIGTVAYMSPEHLDGQAIDERADVWSLGVVLYELLAGRLPFGGGHELAILKAIADEEPRPLREARADVPPAVEAIVNRALQKDPKQRYTSAHELLNALEALRMPTRSAMPAETTSTTVSQRRVGKRALAAAGLLLAIGVVSGISWFAARSTREREARRELDEIRRLVESEQNATALRRLHTLPASLSGHPDVVKLRNEMFVPLTVQTEPAGADVYLKGYGEPDAEWVHLGRSPLETHGTLGAFRWRLTKAGYETFEGTGMAPNPIGDIRFALTPDGSTPRGMVRVPRSPAPIPNVG
ncbi:MAG: protein kinase, partial [Gemmatimonadetes bacterium]|nr:protein kinase [Gemmatimonadota bacterium]